MNKHLDHEWWSEPNEALLPSKDGVEALVMRSRYYGGLCGYIGVPNDHPAYNNQSAWEEIDDVYGGWAEFGVDNYLTRRNHSHYWVGFHCNHPQDYRPYREESAGDPDQYKNLAFVKEELDRIRDKILEMRVAPSL